MIDYLVPFVLQGAVSRGCIALIIRMLAQPSNERPALQHTLG